MAAHPNEDESSNQAHKEDDKLIKQHITAAFIFFGRSREEAEQWIRTSLQITRLFLQSSVMTKEEHWRKRYPSTSLEEIQMAITSDLGAALWHLNGGIEEKYSEPSWTPIPGIEWAIRTKDLLDHLAKHPESPGDIAAENQIARLRKEVERISAKVRRGSIKLPYELKNAPGWKLVALGDKGKNRGHAYLRSATCTIPMTAADLAEIKREREADNVLIEDDND